MTLQPQTLVGVFHAREDAEAALLELRHAKFPDETLGLASRDAAGRYTNDLSQDALTTTGEPVLETGGGQEETGAAIGGLTGFLGAGGLGVLTAAFIPGFAPAVAGIIVLGALTGGITGGFLGAMIGAGVPTEHAQHYASAVEQGRALVTVSTEPMGPRHAQALLILQRHNANVVTPSSIHKLDAESSSDSAPI